MPDAELMDRIVAIVAAGGEMTRSEIMSRLEGCTIPRFHAAAAALAEAGRLRRIGKTKGTRYGLPGTQREDGRCDREPAQCDWPAAQCNCTD